MGGLGLDQQYSCGSTVRWAELPVCPSNTTEMLLQINNAKTSNLSFLGTHGDKVAAAAALPAGPVNELMRASFMLN